MPKTKSLTGYPSKDRPWESGYSFMKRNPIIPNTNVYTLLKLLSKGKMEKTAVDCKDLTISYKKLFQDADTVAAALETVGVKRGDIVAVCMPNFYQAVIPFLACNRIGAITTYLNPGMSDEEIKEYLIKFKSPVLFNYAKSRESNDTLLHKSPTEYIITLQPENLNELDLVHPIGDYHLTKQLDFHCLGSVAQSKKSSRAPLLYGKQNALILFTSGSTGQPKSVVLTNENVIAALMYMNNTSNWDDTNVENMLICVPFAYPYGFVTSMLAALFSFNTAILAPDIGKGTVAYYYGKKPNMVMGSPALLDLTIKNIPSTQDLSSVRIFISGGDFLTVSHAETGKNFFMEHNASVIIGNGTGNAETVSIATTPLGVKNKPETVGKVLVGSSAIVIDPETLQEKQYGEEGMLCISGKHVFKEYFKEPKLTSEAKFQFDGKTYFKTGTLGFLDDDGYFTLTGRASRFYINSSLDKIYLDHVQSVICRFDCVYDCAVVQVADEELLYVNYVFVVPKDGWLDDDNTRARIFDLCNKPVVLTDGKQDQLKNFEIPRKILFLKELPRRSGTDKIDYRKLEEMAKQN